MIVKKFGGTSVQDEHAIDNVAGILLAARQRPCVVVVSACAAATNELVRIGEEAERGDAPAALQRTDQLLERHLDICRRLLAEPQAAAAARIALRGYFDDLKHLVQGVSTLRELTRRTLDQFLCVGELCSSLLLHARLLELGAAAELVDARKVLITGDEFGAAQPLFKWTKRGARVHLLPVLKRGAIAVTQGFIGANRQGETTTLGRGGSDYSAAVFGSVLDAKEIQIWTDVEGILTADPSLLPRAQSIPRMTFNEASELAYFGAKVLHPSTLLPAVRKRIPVRVLNSRQPGARGTIIHDDSSCDVAATGGGAVKSIAYKEGITLVRVQSSRMLMGNGFLGDILHVFSKHRKGVDLVATSLVGLSVTIRDADGLEELVEELQGWGEVTVERNKAICCVVGEGLKSAHHGVAARVFAALDRARLPVEMISHGGSDINLTLLIDEAHIRPAVEALHAEFFERPQTREESCPGYR